MFGRYLGRFAPFATDGLDGIPIACEGGGQRFFPEKQLAPKDVKMKE